MWKTKIGTYNKYNKTVTNMAGFNPTISVITLNVNSISTSTERQRLREWVQKQDLTICSLQETHTKNNDTYRLKVKGWKKICHANFHQKKVE